MSYTPHIAIIGGGASGLFLARKLSENPQLHVTVFERGKQVGAKLRASGGGKANIFNRNIRPKHYNKVDFITALLRQYTPKDLDRQFNDWGMLTVADSEGRVYPATQFAQTVVEVLTDYPSDNVRIETEYDIQHLDYQNGKWRVNDYPTLFDTVVLATGSPAGMIPKNQEGYNQYLKDLHLRIKRLEPSLSGFILKGYPKSLSGCRTKAIVSLYQGDRLIHKEAGEIIFKDNGVSGIVVMNLSSLYRRLADRKNCKLSINLTYWDEEFDLLSFMESGHNMKGILHPKLLAYYNRKPFYIQGLSFDIEDTYPMDAAQVAHGGIAVSEVDEHFAAKKHRNMFILGEMLDVDGLCGGYNLFFAFASAAVVAKSIIQKYQPN
jgi:predicted Rossmann fold flavoprotein